MSAAPIAISIVIPTQRRPGPLARAIRSAFAQQGVDPATIELVVADNDAVPSARAQVKALACEAPFLVRYVHEPKSGVANVRNAALREAGGALIAFLDDDEEAPPGWLVALVETQQRFQADAVFGPVRTRADQPLGWRSAYLEQFFARQGPAETGPIDHYYGCGDSLVRRAALPGGDAPFSAIRNHIGGEDDLLFGAMEKTGARFAWSAEAWVWEYPAPERLSLRYTIRRAFAYGQGATAHSAAAGDRLGVAGWMIQGVAQALVFGVLAAAKFALGAPDRAFALDRAARGLGKTFWWGPFKIHFYGLAAPAGAMRSSSVEARSPAPSGA
jgi:glycosyltransferase involved in cell wall biosynthesis